jgi:hypothetical protein
MTIQRAATRMVIVMFAFVFAGPSWSNGDMFFEAREIAGNSDYVVFGTVKDNRGRYLEGATVTVSVSEPVLVYTTETDVLGRYRSLDVGRAVKGLGYDIDPSRIKVIVVYPGYHEVGHLYRGTHGQIRGVIEFNFVMAENLG